MWKQGLCFVLLIVMLALIPGSAAFGATFNPLKDPAIIGWWTCDEGEGDVVGRVGD